MVMLEGKTGTVIAVTFVKKLEADTTSICLVEIDFAEFYIFGDYNEFLGYVGKLVTYSTRRDYFEGKVIEVINTIASTYVVQTLESSDNIKLIPSDEVPRAVCNFAIDTVKRGDFLPHCIGFLVAVSSGNSAAAKWTDCTVLDMYSKQFNLRIFTGGNEIGQGDVFAHLQAMVGCYIKFTIDHHQKWGYQTQEIEVYSTNLVVSPEVEIAMSQISKAISADKELMGYVTYTGLLDYLKTTIYGDVGYHLVEIASELYFIKSLSNISNRYDITALIRAAITARGYLLPTALKYSRSLANINKLGRTPLAGDLRLISVLDVMAEEPSPERYIYVQINKLVSHILMERRGLINEKEIDYGVSIKHLRDFYGGLL